MTYEENNRKASEQSTYEKEYNDIKNLQNDQQEWRYVAKLLVSELKGGKTLRKSILGDRFSSFSGSVREKEIEKEAEQEQTTTEEADKILLDELKSSENIPIVVENNEKEEETEEDEKEEEENDEEQKEGKDKEGKNQGEEEEGGEDGTEHSDDGEEKPKEAPMDPTMFETLNPETNTQRLFLENINLEETNQLSETELKSTVFNALKTIEKLHADLM